MLRSRVCSLAILRYAIQRGANILKLYVSTPAKWLFLKHGKLGDPCRFYLAGTLLSEENVKKSSARQQ